MKRIIVCLAVLLVPAMLLAKTPLYNIIPLPNQIDEVKGTMKIDGSEQVSLYLASPELKREMKFLEQFLSSKNIPYKVVEGEEPEGNKERSIILQIQPKIIHSEKYRLRISPRRAWLEGSTPQAVFYGLQSFFHLVNNATDGAIPCADIQDSPRFRWRGFMLDESRHFFGVDYVKRTLDMMAYFKMNRFHWHLTDQSGWRIEIKKYPRLALEGGKGCQCNFNSDVLHYYTQEQIKDIVAYAAARYITVIPEIDMPGHATAANKAYPEYSGGPLEKYPHFTFNVGLEATYSYLTDILREIVSMFPSRIIHIGGDEVAYGIKAWVNNPDVQKLMKDKGFTELRQAEQYFLKRMIDSVRSLGCHVAGWDEIVENDIVTDKATVFWWRHDKMHIVQKALESGQRVVMCPRLPFYLDFVQHDSHTTGRRWKGAYNTLMSTYLFPESFFQNTLANSSSFKYIRGVQANLWTEKVATPERADFMIWPRLCAVAEVGWTRPLVKNFSDFSQRMEKAYEYLDKRGVNYFDCRNVEAHPEPNYVEMNH